MTIGLALTYGLATPAFAQLKFEPPTPLILTGAPLLLSQASEVYGIPPAVPVPMPPADTATAAYGAPAPLPASTIQTEGGIRYVSGGVGENARTENAVDYASVPDLQLRDLLQTHSGKKAMSGIQ